MNFRISRSILLNLLAFSAIFVSFAEFLTTDIDRPWVNQIDFNGAVWSQSAHNILRAGLAETQGASTAFYFGPLPIPDNGYYLHHPPLLHLGVAAMFAVFGEHEWAARVIPVACSLFSLVLLWLLVCDTLGARTATFCAVVFASLPMMLRYGTMVNFEPVVFTCIMMALLAFRYWEQSGRALWKWVFFGSLLLGMWVDWAMHLFAMVLFVWWMTRAGGQRRKLAWTVFAITAISGVVYLVHTQLLRSDALQDLHNTFLVRVASDERCKFTFWQWACKVSGSMVNHFLWGGWLLAAAGAFVTYRRRKEKGFGWTGWAAGMVFAMDAIFVGVFQNDSYIHEYIPFYFVIPISLMGGIALNEAVCWIERAARHFHPRVWGKCAGIALGVSGIVFGQARTEEMNKRFCILDLAKREPEALIPALGEAIRKRFSPATRVLCNFMPYYGPQLEYYAKREIAPNLSQPEYWRPFIQKLEREEECSDVGGVVWMGDEDADAILANLPPGKKEFVRLENENFCVWKPAAGAPAANGGRM